MCIDKNLHSKKRLPEEFKWQNLFILWYFPKYKTAIHLLIAYQRTKAVGSWFSNIYYVTETKVSNLINQR